MSLRVLVVENEDDWLEIFSEEFHQHGCVVETASTFAEAARRLEGSPFDIVMLDIWLTARERELGVVGSSGGWRLLVRLARQYPNTSVFVVSQGLDDDEYAFLQGATFRVKGFMKKQRFDPGEIARWVASETDARVHGGEQDGGHEPYPL